MEKTWSKSAQCCAVYQCPLNIGFLIWFSASLSSEQQHFRIYKSKTVARVRQCMWEPFPVIEMITSVFYPPSLFPLTHTYAHTDTLCVPLMFPYVCVLMWAYCNSFFFLPSAHCPSHCTPRHTHSHHDNGDYHNDDSATCICDCHGNCLSVVAMDMELKRNQR